MGLFKKVCLAEVDRGLYLCSMKLQVLGYHNILGLPGTHKGCVIMEKCMEESQGVSLKANTS